jgi:hypothetical protein
MSKKIELVDRRSAIAPLNEYCSFSMGERKGKDDFVMVTEWINMEGVDIEINDVDGKHRFMLTYGQFDAIKACIKEINKSYNSKDL